MNKGMPSGAMEASVFDILVYVFDHYMLEDLPHDAKPA